MQKLPIVLLLSVLLLSCNQAEQPEFISESIEIRYQEPSELIAGNPVDVWLINTSKHCLQFDLLDGMKIFVRQEEQWIEIANSVKFIGDSTVTLMPKGDFFSETLINIRPDFTTLAISTPTDAYALLTGYLCNDNTIQIQKEIPFTINP